VIEDEFHKADAEVGVEIVHSSRDSTVARSMPQDIISFRKQLVSDYHEGAPSLVEKLRKAGKEDMESLLVAMMDEVIGEADHLLGNELVATHNGDLRDASVISFKRAEVLEKAIKAVQTKQQIAQQGGIDVNSPTMIIVFRFFMAKAKETFERMGVSTEIHDLFFRMFGEVTNEWKRELREKFEAERAPR
jgi:hypothetical protein